MTPSLFSGLEPWQEPMADGAVILHGHARNADVGLLADVERIVAQSPWRGMTTPGGYRMSVTVTNCGSAGWTSDEHGYRYRSIDPMTGQAWPAIPASFLRIAAESAVTAGYAGFVPDTCLINRYEPGAQMSMHQDRSERDVTAPVVAISLGLSAVFRFGGDRREDRPVNFLLEHGDVAVWGGPSRLRFHSIAPIADDVHPLLGRCRISLTLRKAG